MDPYATPEELADYLGTDAPDGAARLLLRASELIDEATLGRIRNPWIVNEIDDIAIIPATILEAAKNAACAQVEYWMQTGEAAAIAPGVVSNYQIGSVSVSYGGAGVGGRGDVGGQLGSRARRYLLLAGLLYRGVGSA